MRLPVDGLTAGILKAAAAAVLALALAACGSTGGGSDSARIARLAPVNGPQADYPVVVGEPYVVAGTGYTPEDVLNYDQVGYTAGDSGGDVAVTGSHHTLPLPSYVEVTSLETGRTSLVRIERRGPMTGTELVALSPGALAQLEMAPGAPVRVRRVNPPEDQRALLRAGQPAALRMDTPMPLVEVLRRKLPSAGPAPVQTAAMMPAPQPDEATDSPQPEPSQPVAVAQPTAADGDPPALPPLDSPGEVATATPDPAPPAVRSAGVAADPDGEFIVQAAAFSTADRAARVANVLGGDVTRSGQFYRVRTGPFATRNEAEASLAKVRAAGYRDARIFTSG